MRPYSGYSLTFWCEGDLHLTVVSAYDDGRDRRLMRTGGGSDDVRDLTEYEFALAVGMLVVAHRVIQRRRDNEFERDYYEPFRVHENRVRLAMMGREE